jgi:hypothetical protein
MNDLRMKKGLLAGPFENAKWGVIIWRQAF